MSLVGIVLFTVFPQSSVVFRMPTNPGTYGSTIFINFYFLWGSEGVLVSDCADCTLESEAPLRKTQSVLLFVFTPSPSHSHKCVPSMSNPKTSEDLGECFHILVFFLGFSMSLEFTSLKNPLTSCHSFIFFPAPKILLLVSAHLFSLSLWTYTFIIDFFIETLVINLFFLAM